MKRVAVVLVAVVLLALLASLAVPVVTVERIVPLRPRGEFRDALLSGWVADPLDLPGPNQVRMRRKATIWEWLAD